MFLGEYQHTLDAKGRVSLPARFRAKLTGTVTVAKGFDNSLYVFDSSEYETFLSGLVGRSDFNSQVREVRRFFTSGAVETELDSAGRVSLPANLREWAGLGRDVTVIGNGNRIEMWDAERWSTYNASTASKVEDLAQELSEAGLFS